jgi:hypothetical protein
MSLFSGSATFTRFRVLGSQPMLFNAEHLEQLRANALGQHTGALRVSPKDGVGIGWGDGLHVLGRDFSFERNVIGDMLFFQLVAEQNKLPAEKLKSYYETDLAALARDNPSGYPSRRNKKEAKESAKERLEDEAKDGRFLRRQAIDVAWDRPTNEVLLGSTSATVATRLRVLFGATFNLDLQPLCATEHAAEYDVELVNSRPTQFLPQSPDSVAWVPLDHDYLGNEFLLWLWFNCEEESAEINGTTVFMSDVILLDCPRGVTGRQTITHEGPTRLPEAFRSIQSGKLPRKAGLTVVRLGRQYQFTLNAESLAISGAKIPKPEEDGLDARGLLDARADALRDLRKVIDELYQEFLFQRFTRWEETSPRITAWLNNGERRKG